MIQSTPSRERSARHSAAAPNLGLVARRVPWVPSTLPCECGSEHCRQTVPAGAEAHRGAAGHLLVVPEHRGGGTTVRAADHFFVVESP